MSDRKLERDEWETYFDFLSKTLGSKRVEVEIAGLDIGDQIEVEWAFLEGLSFDPKDNSFYVYTDAIEHRIPTPRAIYVAETGIAVTAIGIQDASGSMQVVKLREPLMLEAAFESKRATKGDQPGASM